MSGVRRSVGASVPVPLHQIPVVLDPPVAQEGPPLPHALAGGEVEGHVVDAGLVVGFDQQLALRAGDEAAAPELGAGVLAGGVGLEAAAVGDQDRQTVGDGVGALDGAPGVVLAHAALGTPFVIITVTATLVGFDRSLTRASASLGANPVTTFFKVQMPLIMPGVISGALFAFITSFDEVVVVLFLGSASQKTLPWQMFTGLREQISPTILAVATLMVVISIILLTVLELLRRRSERLRGLAPS